jgi:hypothetical protein
MTLSQIVNLASSDLGMRYQLTREQIVSFIDLIQKMALGEDMDNFMWWDATLTVLQELSFDSAGYIACADSDIGLPVVEGANTGTLRYFNNTTRKWAVESSSTFTASGAVTLTGGTGAGTLLSASPQAVYSGPYSFPNLTGQSASTTTEDTSNPRCRKLLGITVVTDQQLYGANGLTTSDYGFSMVGYNERTMFQHIRKDFLGRKITFISVPSTSAVYRWVYWRAPETIETENDNNKLVIPEEWHHTCVMQGLEALAKRHLYDDPIPYTEVLTPILKPFWNSARPDWERNGEASNQLGRGQP